MLKLKFTRYIPIFFGYNTNYTFIASTKDNIKYKLTQDSFLIAIVPKGDIVKFSRQRLPVLNHMNNTWGNILKYLYVFISIDKLVESGSILKELGNIIKHTCVYSK